LSDLGLNRTPLRLPSTLRLDNETVYTVLRRAGEGSFGTVFVAYDKEKELNVAVKICEDQKETNRGDR